MNVWALVAHDGRRYRYAHGDLAESFRGNLKNRLSCAVVVLVLVAVVLVLRTRMMKLGSVPF